MTDKQKKALEILNELWYVSRNDGLAKLRDEDYYLLLEVVLDKEENGQEFKIITTPTYGSSPNCADPQMPCTNPFHDCVNCPWQFGTATTTMNGIKEEQK